MGLGGVHQGLRILGETASAITTTRIQKAVSNSAVSADAPADVVHIGPQHIGQIGHFIHERDACGQHGVGGVFGQLGTAHIHPHGAGMVAVEAGIQITHHAAAAGMVRPLIHAHHNAVGSHEIVNRRPFFEELRIGHDIKQIWRHAPVHQFVRNRRTHLVGRSHRHGGFINHQLETLQVPANGGRHRQNVPQVGRTIFCGGRTHSDEEDVTVLYGLTSIGCETNSPIGTVAIEQFFEARLVNGHFTFLQGADFFLVLVQAHHLETQVRQACACDQTDITRTDDCDTHGKPPSLLSMFHFKRESSVSFS